MIEFTARRDWLRFAAAAPLGAAAASAAPPATATTGTRLYNIVDFGAKGDGQSLDTQALQSAIDACSRDNGGTVLVPAGKFVIGTVELKSNVTLHLAAQARLTGSADGKQYHAVNAIPLHGDSTLEDGNVGLLFAVDAVNITIEGTGTIDGQGLQFRSPVRGTPPPSGRGGADRPYHLLFHRCRNLRVRDITLVDSAFHSIRVIQSRYVWMDGLHIHNRVNGNNDGFHFISCENTHVSNCDIETQDDACALFGSCKLVTISNSTFSTRWSVFRFGGGDVADITVSNCVIYQTYGCPIKLHFRPESKVENLMFSNLVMHDVTGPISINLDNRPRRNAPASTTTATGPRPRGYLRNITFQGIRASVVAQGREFSDIAFSQNYRPGERNQSIVLNALGDTYMSNIVFSDLLITYAGGGTAEDAAREMPQIAGEYFEAGTPPAYGLYARNVRGLALHNVRFEVENPDQRPAIVLDHVSDAHINALSAHGHPQAPVVRAVESSDVLISSPRVLTPAAAFLKAEGGSNSVRVEGGDLSKAAVARA